MRQVCCLIAILLAAAHGIAQTPSGSPFSPVQTPAGQPPVFRVSTRLVQVSVVVNDSHGQPVSNLKREDFTITERGKLQEIRFFSMASADSQAAPSAALPPHIFSNLFAERTGVPSSVTVVLLDLVNTSWTNQTYARKGLLTFLEQVQPQDHLALFVLGTRGLTVLHDYAADASSLVARLKKVNDLLPSPLNPYLGLDALADADQRMAVFFAEERVENTFSTFEAIAQHLSGLPGRKNLIWLSAGFPFGFDELPAIGSMLGGRMFTQGMDAAVRALNNSGVAVYPVDARGLVGSGFDASSRSNPRSSAMVDFDSMRVLADRTGGRAAYNRNDLDRAIRRAVDDARVTYTIGYYSTDETQDGKFREIKVKVNRPRLDVRYRKGYFALKPSDNSPKTRDDEVRAAMWSPLESTAIAVNARADFLDEPEPNTVNLVVQIDPAAVDFRKEGDRWKADLDIVYVQKDEQGLAQGDGVTDNLRLALTDSNYAKVAKEGVIVEHRFPRAPGAIALRIVVRDVASGSIGSLTIPFSQTTAQPEKLAPK